MRIIYLFIAFLCIADIVHAQYMPRNQPEQDACEALVVCGTSFTSAYSYQGIGRVMDLPNGSPCGPGEVSSMWLRLNVNTPGDIVFTITPVNHNDDYDFSVVDITTTGCSNLSNIIRCNYNSNYTGIPANSVVGINNISTTDFVTGGTPGNHFLRKITANAGDVYLVLICNIGVYNGSSTSSGFTIDFTGSTATFNQPPLPVLNSVTSTCNYQDIVLTVNQPVRCGSIAADGSDFLLSPVGTVTGATGATCSGSIGYTTKITLSLTSPLPNGSYVLNARSGTDGNTLLNLCNGALALPDTLQFNVLVPDVIFLSIDTPACQTITINMNEPVSCDSIAPDGSDFIISGPSTVLVASAKGGNGCVAGGVGGYTQQVKVTLANPVAVDGVYDIVVQNGTDGNTLMNSCGKMQNPGDRISFTVNSYNGLLKALPDTTICNDGVTITLGGINNGVAPSGGFTYKWSPANGVVLQDSLVTSLLVPANITSYTLATIDGRGCYLRDSITIRFQPITSGIISPVDTAICLGEQVQLQGGGGVSYKWFDNAMMQSNTDMHLSCTACTSPIATPPVGDNSYYLVVTNDAACRDTLLAHVYVHPLPDVTVSPVEITVKYGDTILLNAENATTYSWSPATLLNDPKLKSPATGQLYEPVVLTVTGFSEYGCVNTADIHVNIDYEIRDIMPNAFTPNGDGKNDIFRLAGITYQKLIKFRVFDRWGKVVFQSNDISNGWDGTINGTPAAIGTYFYVAEFSYPDGKIKEYKGDVTLIR